jgi:hypothetical protein
MFRKEFHGLICILRVFRTGTWLTVYRPLDILKLLGDLMGCLAQRLSVVKPFGNEDLNKDVILCRPNVSFKF